MFFFIAKFWNIFYCIEFVFEGNHKITIAYFAYFVGRFLAEKLFPQWWLQIRGSTVCLNDQFWRDQEKVIITILLIKN